MKVIVVHLNTRQDGAIPSLDAACWQDGVWTDTLQRITPPSGRGAKRGEDSADEAWTAFAEHLAGGATLAIESTTTLERLDEMFRGAVVWPDAADVLDLTQMARILAPEWTSVVHLPAEAAEDAEDAAPDNPSRRLWEALTDRALRLPVHTLQQMAHIALFLSRPFADWLQWAAEQRQARAGLALPEGCRQIQSLVFRDDPAAGLAESGDAADGKRMVRTSADVDAGDTDEEADATGAPSAGDVDAPDASPARADGVADAWPLAEDLLGPEGPFASRLPGFQVRQGQLEMARAVREALDADAHLMVEAGTGTGKSLAYLVPAALYALSRDTRVVVSTHTIALQDQIEHRDFPLLRSVIEHPLELAVLKGRTHYVCMRKLQQEVHTANWATDPGELEAYLRLLAWLVETETGDREELPVHGRMHEVWSRVQSETETCIGKRCPFFKPCYYFRARGRAYQADVVIANHSLVFSDLKAERRVLPRYDKLIVDEAHHLEEEATRHLGDEVHWGAIAAMMQRLAREGGRSGVIPELLHRLQGAESAAQRVAGPLEQLLERLADVRKCVEAAFTALAALVPPGQSELRLTPAVQSAAAWQAYQEQTQQLGDQIRELERIAARLEDAAQVDDADLSGRLVDARGFLMALTDQLRVLMEGAHLADEAWVTWVQAGPREGSASGPLRISLHRAPIDVASILREYLFDATSSVILTSATLTVDGEFHHAVRRFGLAGAQKEGRLRTLTVASPFSMSRQALLCVPTDVPELARMEPEEAAPWVGESIVQLARVSGGRLLALFTSHALLRATAERARPALAPHGIVVYAQGVDGGRTQLLDAFRKNPRSVLFGTQSFWEGIDLPGDQLVALVIVRLPFSPPSHPVHQARCERLEAEGLNPFAFHSLPDAVVRFRQGVGRLIRTVDDRGVVVVFDKRIITHAYGRTFIRSIPGLRAVTGRERDVLARAAAFLRGQRTPG
ncbi:ATP-dependent DNA helicase [Alicyclobacillus macrosporangiidus]|uniref:DNA 5'-3' helicase n=1 Tax=Alicyclobacillus macrosporangiidus TaxID=392015 RepID=A0A1I7KUV1_9BACL|nr:helicase C-terminal domain-containing protein [Alicyclobacillus macrosporangiidus]SFV01074.1 ATP-dependent DNA helicase DinG [Alicyclobacillus macrosporangiidus]